MPPISNYTDRLQIVMASGDLPDIIYTWSFGSNYEKWAADGLIWELDDLVGKYPNLTKNITKNMWEMARTSTPKLTNRKADNPDMATRKTEMEAEFVR